MQIFFNPLRLRSELALIAFALTFTPFGLVHAKTQPKKYLTERQIPAGVRFGSEMTISSDKLYKSYPVTGLAVAVETPISKKLMRQMRKNIIAKYAPFLPRPYIIDLSFHSHYERSATKIIYQNGFELTVFADPGALEMNSSPASLLEVEKNLPAIQSDFFDEGRKLGLAPANFAGAGHIHIEVSKLHPVTVRNFIVDFFNHTGLAAGALNDDVMNAIGIGEIPLKNKLILAQAISDFDTLEDLSTEQLLNLVRKAFDIPFEQDLDVYQKFRKAPRARKYFALGLESFAEIGTIEVRSLRPQASAASYLKLLKLFVARLKLAEKQRKNNIRVPLGPLTSVRGQPQLVLAQFDHYLSEVKLKIEDYREFVLPWWQTPGGEFDKYLAAREQQRKSNNRSKKQAKKIEAGCENLLQQKSS